MGTKKNMVTSHGVLLYITDDHFRVFFANFVEVADVSSIKNKAGIASGDFEIMVALNKKKIMDIPNILTCGGRLICNQGNNRMTKVFKGISESTKVVNKR